MAEHFETYKRRIIDALFHHPGQGKAIGADELYRLTFRDECENKINDTRPLRRIITELRRQGYPIGSISRKLGGGYYWATREELNSWRDRVEKTALKKLQMINHMKKTAKELSGQQRFNF